MERPAAGRFSASHDWLWASPAARDRLVLGSCAFRVVDDLDREACGWMRLTWPRRRRRRRVTRPPAPPIALFTRRLPAIREPSSGTLLVARRDGNRRMCPAGRDITIRGWALRYYLWLQIIAGWLLARFRRRRNWFDQERLIAPDEGGSPSWIRIEPCVSRHRQNSGAFWRKSARRGATP